MSGTPSRLVALRGAVSRVARRRRVAEHRPAEAARLAGRYRGRRLFSLEWVESECGYRRTFPRDSRWFWEDPTVFSTVQVVEHISAGLWSRLGDHDTDKPGDGL